MFFRALLTFLLTLWLTSQPLYSQVRGTIVGPGAERYPIAISPLRNLGAGEDAGRLSEGIADIIARDLELSGWFRILDRSAYIEDPQKSGITLGNFDFRDWSVIGAEGLAKGGFNLGGDELAVELRLFDVYQAKQIVGKKYAGKAKEFRRIAHKFADEIIFQFTGVPGVFNTRIAYVSNAGGRFKQVYIAHLDGSERIQVTKDPTINLFPSWSPDGRSIFYSTYGYRERAPGLYLFNLFTGKDTKFLSGGGLNLGGKWSPDGKFVAMSLERQGNVDIYLLDTTGKIVRRLTEDPAIEVSPAWSPDGGRLAFVSSRSGSPQIYVLELANGKARRLTYTGGYNTSPSWSPAGDKIAYTGRAGGRFQIFTIAAQGGDAQQLTSNSADNEDPSWSPDGRYLAFTSNRKGRYQLYLMQASGENQQRLTGSGGDDTNPSWSPRLE
ncbi:MAG: Tol-Pal system beta propeller repeat protein TolB [Deltaproteobacteria bacterium]|nr:Tol-Pal system beta propeller repeat protein TolB [Deltaproteobacteria bacterium]